VPLACGVGEVEVESGTGDKRACAHSLAGSATAKRFGLPAALLAQAGRTGGLADGDDRAEAHDSQGPVPSP
jgi:hypothetical protein